MTDLPSVRRLEAVTFRAWPAASVLYDGSWLIRLTAGHDSKRLNSLNPLDPSDTANIAVRLEKAARRFADYGRPLTVRQTPLTPLPLVSHMDEQSWSSLGETIVMRVDLTVSDPGDGMDHLPLRDVGRFVDARLAVCGEAAFLKAGLSEIINAIKPERGMFLFEDAKSGPEAVCLAVQDSDMAGILQMIVRKDLRRQGIGAAILGTSLRWARLRGAKTAWLQVEADNVPAIAMYRTFGFGDVYRYTYRRPAVVGASA